MKKIMSLMLGLSLVIGCTTFAFAQDSSSSTSKKTSKKKHHKKKGSDNK